MRQVSKSVKLVSEDQIVAVMAPCSTQHITKGKVYNLVHPMSADSVDNLARIVGGDSGHPSLVFFKGDTGCAHLGGDMWIPVIKKTYCYVSINPTL